MARLRLTSAGFFYQALRQRTLGFLDLALGQLQRCFSGSLLRSLLFCHSLRCRFSLGLCASCFFCLAPGCFLSLTLSQTLNVLPVLLFDTSVQRFEVGF